MTGRPLGAALFFALFLVFAGAVALASQNAGDGAALRTRRVAAWPEAGHCRVAFGSKYGINFSMKRGLI